MMNDRNSNGVPDNAAAWSSCGQALWRNLMACPCPPRQIRKHLLFADIFAWLLIIALVVLLWSAS